MLMEGSVGAESAVERRQAETFRIALTHSNISLVDVHNSGDDLGAHYWKSNLSICV